MLHFIFVLFNLINCSFAVGDLENCPNINGRFKIPDQLNFITVHRLNDQTYFVKKEEHGTPIYTVRYTVAVGSKPKDERGGLRDSQPSDRWVAFCMRNLDVPTLAVYHLGKEEYFSVRPTGELNYSSRPTSNIPLMRQTLDRTISEIGALRIQKGITKERLADNLDVGIQTIERWDSGVELPIAFYLRKLESIFELYMHYLGTGYLEY